MTKIIADTTACLPPEVAQRYKIPVVPQVVTFGEDTFYEENSLFPGPQIDFHTFMQRLRTSSDLPKTAAPPPELFRQLFEELAPAGEPILCIHPSVDVSGTVRSAVVAAQDFPTADIRVIDTRLIATPLGTIVEQAAKWATEGLEADEIVARVESLMKRCRVYFLVATLEYLSRGGRIGGASYLLGSVLQIKPILTFQDGRVEVQEKERTHKRAILRLKELVSSQIAPNGLGYLTIMHADALEDAQLLASELSQATGQVAIPVLNVPPAIATHAGPGVMGTGFFVSE